MKNKKMSLKTREVLKEIRRIATMETANFKHIIPTGSYPTNEVEADQFIKARIKIWLDSYIIDPIDELLKPIN